MLKILFADDHALVRDGTRPFLQLLDRVVDLREAQDLQGALALFAEPESPDLVVLDLHMPGMNRFDGIKATRQRYPKAKIVVVSGYYDKQIVNNVIEAGANGFIPKTSTGRSMLSAIQIVLEGEVYVPHGLSESVPVNPLPRSTAGPPIGDGSSPLAQLSPRQLAILRFVIDGMTNKEIGRNLDLQEITVKGHLRNAYKKMGASNRADAVRIAFECGLE